MTLTAGIKLDPHENSAATSGGALVYILSGTFSDDRLKGDAVV